MINDSFFPPVELENEARKLGCQYLGVMPYGSGTVWEFVLHKTGYPKFNLSIRNTEEFPVSKLRDAVSDAIRRHDQAQRLVC